MLVNRPLYVAYFLMNATNKILILPCQTLFTLCETLGEYKTGKKLVRYCIVKSNHSQNLRLLEEFLSLRSLCDDNCRQKMVRSVHVRVGCCVNLSAFKAVSRLAEIPFCWSCRRKKSSACRE